MPAASPEEVRRGADEILSRPEFQAPPRSLYQQVLDWIGDRIGDVVGALVSGGAGGLVAWALLVAAIALLGYLLLRAVQRDRRQPPGAASGANPVLDADAARPADAWLAEAARFEAEERWRESLRCRYRALVATLASRGVVEEVPGRTTGEYRTLVRRSRPAVDEPFTGATDLFERAWYGSQETGPEDASAFRDLADRVTAGGSP